MLQRNNNLGCVNSDTIVNLIKYDGGGEDFYEWITERVLFCTK
jgi:hypothetical protein